jgi:hypothetical protein
MNNLFRLVFVTISAFLGVISFSAYSQNLQQLGGIAFLGAAGWFLASFLPKLVIENVKLKRDALEKQQQKK